jgi:hypothetical protein
MRGLLRLTVALFAITLVGSSLALLVGRFMPTQMLTTTLTTGVTGNRSGITDFLLIDLNRHLRITIPIPTEGVEDVVINENGREALIQSLAANRRHLYHYDLITDTLFELNSTYIDPNSGAIAARITHIYNWTSNGDDLWAYNASDQTIYRLSIITNIIQPVVTLPVVENNQSGQPFPSNSFLSFSSTGAQIGIIVSDYIYLVNTDGSNLRQYPNPLETFDGYGYWLENEQYFYVSSYSSTLPMRFWVINATSGEIVVATQDLEGSHFFSPCVEGGKLVYIDPQNEAQLLNYQTGETQNFSHIPEFIGQTIISISWILNCEWVLVTIEAQTDSSGGFTHYAAYIVSQDRQTIYELGEAVNILNQVASNRYVMTEAQGTEEIVYDVYFDGVVHKTRLSSDIPDEFFASGNWWNLLVGDVHRFVGYDANNHISVMNVRSGEVEYYFALDELIGSFPIQWLWQ